MQEPGSERRFSSDSDQVAQRIEHSVGERRTMGRIPPPENDGVPATFGASAPHCQLADDKSLNKSRAPTETVFFNKVIEIQRADL